MTYPHPRSRIAAGLLGLVAVLLLGGCSDASLESLASQSTNLDDRLTIRGEICTSVPTPDQFPVKVVIIVDQSGSMCVSDPPGSQGAPGICEQVNPIVNPNGNLVPARSRALRRLRDQFAPQPNVEIAVVPFETNVSNVFPPAPQRFAPAAALDDAYIANLQNTLGKGTDYEGALSEAYARVADDIAATQASSPDKLPRTRYVVVFLTDGTPYPRCSAIDTLPIYADPYNPDLTWEDNALPFCNVTDPQDQINGWTVGTDRNQNYQLFALVDRIVNLKALYNVGDIRLHTVLLFNEESVRACGTICQDIYGVYPNVAPADYPAAAHAIARFVLTRMAQRGNGIFQEFSGTNVQTISLGALDYTSMISPNVMKSIIVQALRSEPDGRKRVLDSDGDGLPDETDNSFSLQTNKFAVDTDNDCLDDNFEDQRSDNGFIAYNDRDARGCDVPTAGGCSCRDTDGDGLGLKAEEYLQSKAGLVDGDSDGIPDGMEARYGLNPRESNLGQDTDGDGFSDGDELKKGSNPLIPDRVFYEGEGYQYEVTAVPQANGSVCYQFAVSNLKLLTPPAQNSAQVNQGYNLFKVWFAESPESAISTDYGFWRSACAWARFQPPSIRQPTGPELALSPTYGLRALPQGGFGRPDLMSDYPDNYSACDVRNPPNDPNGTCVVYRCAGCGPNDPRPQCRPCVVNDPRPECRQP